MPRKPENPGTCAYCGDVISKRSVAKHLEKCARRQTALHAAEAGHHPVETLWHLSIQDAHNIDYWLDLEMIGSASLEQLDHYLRVSWLECYGHLSRFMLGGKNEIEVQKAHKANAIFKPRLMLRHEYDSGTTSETEIKVVGFCKGKATSKHPIALLARNNQVQEFCQECEQPATWLCVECIYEEDKPGYLCNEHIEDHPHERYVVAMRLYNSPRTGMCGYNGPAIPPY